MIQQPYIWVYFQGNKTIILKETAVVPLSLQRYLQ